MTTTDHPTDLLPVQQHLASEADIRQSLLPVVKTALDRPGATVRMGKQRTTHITVSALREMAGHLGVSIEASIPVRSETPDGNPCVIVQCKVTRADGVQATASGVCECPEGRMFRDWHAACGMAETRAESRALMKLLAPAIRQADSTVSTTGAEIMPNDTTGGRQRPITSAQMTQLTSKHKVLAAAQGDKDLAARCWEAADGDLEAALDLVADEIIDRVNGLADDEDRKANLQADLAFQTIDPPTAQ